jgi:hypothetical protein
MTHRVTAVVHDPEQERVLGVKYVPELFVFETSMWYEAFDILTGLWIERHPPLNVGYGLDDLEIRSISMVKVED